MEKTKEIGELTGIATLSEYDPECPPPPVDSVEGLRQVYEDKIETHKLLGAFLLDVSVQKANIDGAMTWSESTLGVWQGLLRNRAGYAIEDDSCTNLPSDEQDRDIFAIATIRFAILVLEQGDN